MYIFKVQLKICTEYTLLGTYFEDAQGLFIFPNHQFTYQTLSISILTAPQNRNNRKDYDLEVEKQ